MAASVRATVVVPVKDGGALLEALLSGLQHQEVPGGLEVLAIDSGSSDGSLETLRRRGVRLIEVPPTAFDHGETRNLGAREAKGTVALFMSQDVVPSDGHVVRRLVEAVEKDPRLAGAFARQVPRAEADPLTRRDLSSWVAARPEPRTVFLEDHAAFASLPPLERHRLTAFDNVASAVRRDVLLAHPFAPTRFGEDVEWGQRMLRLGYGLAYVPDAVVVHSHPRTARALLRRNYLGHRLLHRLFGLRTVPDAPHLVRASIGAVVGDVGTLLREGAGVSAFAAAPAQAVAGVYGQYRGARDEALGRPYPEWGGGGTR